MKFKHLALCCAAFALSQTAFAAPDVSSVCTNTANMCTSITPRAAITVKDKTADAWQIQCTNDTAPTAILYGMTGQSGDYRYFVLSADGVATNSGKGETTSAKAVSDYCKKPLLQGPPDANKNPTTVPRKALSDWYKQ